jgi:hypothetical protein
MTGVPVEREDLGTGMHMGECPIKLEFCHKRHNLEARRGAFPSLPFPFLFFGCAEV